MLSLNSTVVAASGQISCDLSGEAVILSLPDGVYYGLDPVGARIWSLLQTPRRVRELLDTILAEYDVAPAECERDLLRILGELESRHLIEQRVDAA